MSANSQIGLASPLTFANAFRFPIQSKGSRKDLIIGGLILFIPFVGWLLNMGHRIVVTHRLLHGVKDPWPAWQDPFTLFKHGMITFAGMVVYHLPASVVFAFAIAYESTPLFILAGVLWILGTCVIPGYMTAYCVNFEAREVFNMKRSIIRVARARNTYWRAWLITLCAMTFSFAGLIGFGVLFFWTSVWFWQVAAFCFANTMTQAAMNTTIDTKQN